MIESLESLKTTYYYIEDFQELTTEELSEIYWFLKCHANYEICRKNLYLVRVVATDRLLGL